MKMKRWLSLLLAAVLTFSLAGCGFSIGNVPSGSKDGVGYEELFPDAAAEWGKSHKESFKGYKFSLAGYGSMMVYVDTTNGHKFNLRNEQQGFAITDADGNDVLSAMCVPKEIYEENTMYCDTVETTNGRDFFKDNIDGSSVRMCYLADVGMDAGLIVEVLGDAKDFRLVSLTGTPLSGASANIYDYKGQEEVAIVEPDPEPAPEPDPIPDPDPTPSPDPIPVPGDEKVVGPNYSTIDTQTANILDNLDTDYVKVNWKIRYPLSEDYENIIISIAPTSIYDMQCLVVAVTNLYDYPLNVSLDGAALDSAGKDASSFYFTVDSLGSGNTMTFVVFGENGNDPDGSLSFSNIIVSEYTYSTYIPWVADWSAKRTDTGVSFEYDIYNEYNYDMTVGLLYVFLTDSNNDIVAIGTDYLYNEISAGDSYPSTINITLDELNVSRVSGAAMFANSVDY